MIISGYLYHSQIPMPELWIRDIDPCVHDKESLDLVARYLHIDNSEIDKVVNVCKNLSQTHFARSLYDLDHYDGLKLEAARSIISSDYFAGGDILRMGNNIKRLDESDANVMTIRMTDWIENTEKTSVDVVRFLFDDRQKKFMEPMKTNGFVSRRVEYISRIWSLLIYQ